MTDHATAAKGHTPLTRAVGCGYANVYDMVRGEFKHNRREFDEEGSKLSFKRVQIVS